ncbi:hypothetical protein RUND412_009121, partial [Rhizina undulata]
MADQHRVLSPAAGPSSAGPHNKSTPDTPGVTAEWESAGAGTVRRLSDFTILCLGTSESSKKKKEFGASIESSVNNDFSTPQCIASNASADDTAATSVAAEDPKTIGQWISKHLVVLSNGKSPPSLNQNIVLPRHIQVVSRSDITERLHT